MSLDKKWAGLIAAGLLFAAGAGAIIWAMTAFATGCGTSLEQASRSYACEVLCSSWGARLGRVSAHHLERDGGPECCCRTPRAPREPKSFTPTRACFEQPEVTDTF